MTSRHLQNKEDEMRPKEGTSELLMKFRAECHLLFPDEVGV